MIDGLSSYTPRTADLNEDAWIGKSECMRALHAMPVWAARFILPVDTTQLAAADNCARNMIPNGQCVQHARDAKQTM